MRNLKKEIGKKRIQESIIELSEYLAENHMESVIYLPDVNMFSMTGTVGGQIICAGLMLSQLCERTGKEIDQILDEEFYTLIFPACKELLKEGKKL